MTRAAAYVRISRDTEGTRAGVKRQREEVTAEIQRRGWEHVATFEDNDLSAYSGKPRPGYEAMAAEIETGGIDAVVCFAADRLTRHPRDLEDLIDVLERNRTDVVALHDGYLDLSTSGGRVTARILGAISRQESERKSERIKASKRKAAESGGRHGGPRPFGFEADQVTHRPEEADAIRQAGADLLDGVSLGEIARRWNAAGLLTPRGNLWRGTLVRNVVGSPRVAGKRVHRGSVVADAAWEPIVDEPTHQALQAMFAARKRGGSPPRSLLGGLLTCGLCGAPMHGKKQKNHKPGYSCSGCKRVSVVAAAVEREIESRLLDALLEPETFAALTEGTDHDLRRREISEEIAAIDQRRAELGQRMAAAGWDEVAWTAALGEFGRQTAELQRELRELTSEDRRHIDPEDLERIRELWPEMNRDEKRAVYESSMSTMVVNPASGPRWSPDRVEVLWA